MASATGCRLTLKFNFGQQIRFCGWSESYDLGFADLTTAGANLNKIQAFLRDRCDCLGIGPLLMSATVSNYIVPAHPGDPPIRRSTLAVPVPPFPPSSDQAYNKAFGPFTADPTRNFYADFGTTVYYISCQTALSSVPVYRRNLWIAGLPDLSDETQSPSIVEGNTLSAISKFIGDINNTNGTLAGQCLVSIRSVDRGAGQPIKPCTAWNQIPNTYTVPGHGFTQGQAVSAEGMKAAPGGAAPRGRYLVGPPIDANTISLQGASTPGTPERLGGFRPIVPTWNTIATAKGIGFSKRNKGRPSGLSVGRRSKPRTSRV